MDLKRLKAAYISTEMDQKCQIADRLNQKNDYNVYLNKMIVDVSEDEDMRKLRLRRQAAKGLYYSTEETSRPKRVKKFSCVMRPLTRAAKYHKALKNITIDVESCYEADNQSFKYMSESLKYLTSLQKIHIAFDDCEKVSNEGIKSLGRSLKPLTALQNVNIRIISAIKVTRAGWRYFGQCLKHLSSLQKLKFDLKSCSIIDEVLNQSLKYLISLKSVSLRLSEYQAQIMTTKGLKYLGEGLKRLNSLQNIALEFNTKKFSNEEITYLCDCLKGLTVLQSLTLIFGRDDFLRAPIDEKFDDIGLQALSECLKHLKSLQNVELWFSTCSMTNDGLELLSESLGHLALVKRFKILFKGCSRVSKQQFEDFKEGLKSLKSLQKANVLGYYY